TVDDVAARYHVKDLARVRDGDGARGFDGPHGVAAVDVVPRRARDRDHASRVLGADVASGDAHKSRPHFEARDPLGGLDRGHDRLHGRSILVKTPFPSSSEAAFPIPMTATPPRAALSPKRTPTFGGPMSMATS